MLKAFTSVQPLQMTEKLLDIGKKQLMLGFRGRIHDFRSYFNKI